jgi:hypothetical protein
MSFDADCGRMTAKHEEMQMLQTAAFARISARTGFA